MLKPEEIVWTDVPEAEELSRRAKDQHAAGALDQAIRHAQRAVEIRREQMGHRSPHLAIALGTLAKLVEEKSGLVATRPLYEEALRVFENVYGDEHPHCALVLYSLILILIELGEYETAKALARRKLKIDVKVYGLYDPNVDTALVLLSRAHRGAGEIVGAAYVSESMKRPRAFDDDSAKLATAAEKAEVAAQLAEAAELDRQSYELSQAGKHAEAEQLAVRVLAIHEWVYGTAHPTVATSLNNLATVRAPLTGDEPVLPLMFRSLAIREALFGKVFPDLAGSLYNLGATLHARGERHRPIDFLTRYLLCMNDAPTPITARALEILLDLHAKNASLDEFKPRAWELLEKWEAALGAGHGPFCDMKKRVLGIIGVAPRALGREELFTLVAEEVFRDGVVEDHENELLNRLMSFLKLPIERAKAICREAQDKFKKGEMGAPRALDRSQLFERVLEGVYADGQVDDEEKHMVKALRVLLGVGDETFREIMKKVEPRK